MQVELPDQTFAQIVAVLAATSYAEMVQNAELRRQLDERNGEELGAGGDVPRPNGSEA